MTKATRRNKIIKIVAETIAIENRKAIENNLKTQRWFFEEIKKINKPLAKVNSKERSEDTNDQK